MQLLARVPRPRPRPRPPHPTPTPIRPSLRNPMRPSTRRRIRPGPGPGPRPELSFPRMYERRNRIERVARADAREAAQHDVVLVRERVQRVERVQLRCVYG